MATEVNIFDATYQALGDMRSAQFRFVEFTADRQVQRTSATTAIMCGILQNNPNSGQEAVVRHLGMSKLEMTSAAAGSLIGTDATGRGVKVVYSTNSGQYTCAQSIEAVSASSRGSVIVSPVPIALT